MKLYRRLPEPGGELKRKRGDTHAGAVKQGGRGRDTRETQGGRQGRGETRKRQAGGPAGGGLEVA